MKKTVKSILVLTMLMYSAHTYAQQNSVGVNTSSPNPNAVLELVSPNNDQGFLVPRLTTDQRNLMISTLTTSSNVNGLMVYDTDQDQYYFWKDDRWKEGLGVFDGFEAGGDLDGTYPNPTIALNAVTANKIGTNAVTNSKIQADAVTTEKIADEAVTAEKIELSGVTAGTYGNEYSIAQFTVNDRGLISVAQEVIIQIDSSNIVDLSIIGDDIKNGT
ncbi:MAG: hypothetical protein NXI20_28715, partial [bacterium]|nr:hypothetical protein [bacterium]